MKELLKRVRQLSIFILAISIIGCSEDDDNTLPEVNAGFTHTINEDTGTVSFINITTDAQDYLWDFGDGTTSTEINPIKTYPTGTYTVVLKATNVAGASDTYEDTFTILIKEAVSLPITFDNTSVAYEATVFNGTAFEIVDNPDTSGSNPESSKVGAITNSGIAYEGIFFDLATAIDLSTDKTITMNFWADAPVDVLLKLEEGSAAAIEATASHGGTGWEKITFNFDSAENYSRFTLFVDGPGTTTGTFYIDDIEQSETIVSSGCDGDFVAAASLPLDFEGCETFPVADNFGAGITSEVVANPFKTGINTSDFVLMVDKPTDSDFYAGIQNTFDSNFDLTTTNTFKIKVYSTKANVTFRFELALNPQSDPVTGNPAPVFKTIANANEWTEVAFTFTGLPGGPTAYNQLVIKPDNNETDSPITEGGTYYLDDLVLVEADGGGNGGTFDSGLLTNGDFENGATPWTIGVGSDPAPIVTDGDNTYYSVNVETAGNAYDVNLSQKLEIVAGSTYTLTFDAWSDRARSILAGIGLSGGEFTNVTETVNITTERTTYTLSFTADGFGAADARVLFDNGAEVGIVNIDNVSLILESGTGADSEAPVILLNGDATINLTEGDSFIDQGASASDNVDGDISGNITVGGDTVDANTAGTYVITYNVSDAAGNAASQVIRTVIVTADSSGTFDDGLLTNGDFENGAASWTIGVGTDPAPVTTDGDNTYYSVNVETAGNAYDVNLTQKLEIIEGSTYTLTFDAWSDRARSILAGIGLSGGNFANVNETVNITTERTTYTVNLTAEGFGASDARVLFDNGAEIGVVNIDNVSLVLVGGSGGNSEDPVITLNGDATVNLTEGATYTDSGATAIDNADGDISSDIVVGGDSVDTNTPGTYVITYNVSDSDGNTAAQVTRTVIVTADNGGTSDEFIVNGDFETGDQTGWLFFDNGGTTSVTDTESNGGTYSAKITSAPGKNPGIKQERFGQGTITANQEIQVTLDSKVESLVDGAIVNVLAFSESSTEGAPATLHNLGTINVAPGSWNANTFTFTTAADVSGGVSILIEVVCGGAESCAGIVYFDNVSVTLAP